MQAYRNMASTEGLANYIATTRQRDHETAKAELLLGAQWFQKQIYKGNILQTAFRNKYTDSKIFSP